MSNIERFKEYLRLKGYQNCPTRDFSEDMHGVRCEIHCLPSSEPNKVRRDFTQCFAIGDNWYNVRLGIADFDNADITQELFTNPEVAR